jgi:hypothetical protein
MSTDVIVVQDSLLGFLSELLCSIECIQNIPICSMFAKVIHEAESGQVNNEVGIEYARSAKFFPGI